jgi:serine/threonine-protein kinase
MGIAPGTRLGIYEVTGAIGAGGMGEVYRARDTKLNRDVALKLLPEAVADDPERRMRFEREARTLAALNHPHIAQIHGFEQANDISALVMELVDGDDLAERIARGPVPLDEAIPIARQVAEALEAAHEAGIIHRDLKPSNIKVRADGTVKVLDFGLAKAAKAGGPGGAGPNDLLNSPTITSPAMTLQGVILGTAAYMSPEQAKGKTVDKRADIWAFGCVLYEMLTGRRAFEGDDVSDTLAAVLRAEPDWSAIPPATPPALMSIIKRCLERDLRRRVADTSVIRFVVEELPSIVPVAKAAASDTSQLQSRIDLAVTRARRHWLTRQVIPAAVLLAAAVAAVAFAVARSFESRPPQPILRFAIVPQVRPLMAISPDGTQLVYLASGRAYLRRLSDFQEQVIPSPDLGRTVITPAFSPDGRSIAFFSGSERLVKKLDVAGGTPQRVCQVSAPASFGLTWETSGILVGAGAAGIVRCNPAGGEAEQLAKAEDDEEASSPSILPGGDALLFAVKRGQEVPWDEADIVAQSLSTGVRKTILSGGADPRYVGTGHLIYTQRGVQYAMRFDPTARERRGDPVPVIEGIRRSSGSAHLSISSTGTAAYIAGPVGPVTSRLLGIGDRAGVVTALPVPEANFQHVRASRDGSTLAIGTHDGTQAIVWTYPLSGSAAMQRLTHEGNNSAPIWSPDGASVAYASDREGKPGIYRQRIDGTGSIERLTSAGPGELHMPESWSPDGLTIAFAVRKENRYSLWKVSVDSRTVAALDTTSSVEWPNSQFSPDGRWIAFGRAPSTDLESSDRGIFVRAVPPGDRVYQAPRQMVDFHPVWSRTGRELIFVASATAGVMAAVDVRTAAGVTFGAPTRFPSSVTGDRLSIAPRAYDVLPDGRFVGLITEDQSRRALTEIRVIVNWFDELNAKVPAK